MVLTFPKGLRLLTASNYRRVFNAKVKVKLGCKGICLIAVKSEFGSNRVGIIIAKREIARAVARNTYKRIIRESFRCQQHKLHGYDCIVIIKAAITTLTRQQVRMNLERLWQRLANY